MEVARSSSGRELRLSAATKLALGESGSGERRLAAGSAHSLPCLNSNNCISQASPAAFSATPYHRRIAFALWMNTTGFVERFGIDHVGFLTLTFADHVVDVREAQRRLHSLITNVISKRYEAWIVVLERMKSGRIHFHILVALSKDIRSGADFAAFERCCYRSANDALRDEWAFWRATSARYGFGRTELLPVKSNAEGVGRYVGKYIGKHVKRRELGDKGSRMVRYGGKFPRASSAKFQFNSVGAAEWRRKLAAFCAYNGISDWADLQRKCGTRWGYFFQHQIRSMK